MTPEQTQQTGGLKMWGKQALFFVAVIATLSASAQSADEEVTLQNGAVKLTGTLAFPEGPGPFPAVVLLSGSGQQDRDWTFGNLKMAKFISERLTSKGIAVLRYDDRGVGGSGGEDELKATFLELCGDARAGMKLLRSRPHIGKVGLCGHSGGAIIGAMTAAEDKPAVDFLILISGPFISGQEVDLDQARNMPNIYRATPDQSDADATREGERITRLVGDYLRTGGGLGEVVAAWDHIMRERIRTMPKEKLDGLVKRFGSEDSFRTTVVADYVGEYQTPWEKDYFLNDPADFMRKVTCPVLALFGSADVHVRVGLHRPPLLRALAAGECPDVTIKIIAGADHAYTTGELYAKGEMIPDSVESMADWIRARAAK